MLTRDSAGIRIVASQQPTQSTGWQVDSVPLLTIGTVVGAEEYQLHRVGSAARLADGRVVIGNSGTSEIRVYDGVGVFLDAIGRLGEGPGEFTRFTSIPLWTGTGGSIIAEASANRLNIFESTGALREVVVLDPQPVAALAFPTGIFANGDLVANAQLGELQGAPGALISSLSLYLRFDRSGRLLSTLAELNGRPRIVHQFEGATRYPFVPLSTEPLARPVGDRLVLMRGAGPELELRDTSGNVVSLIHWGSPIRRVQEIWDRFKAEDLARAGDSPQRPVYEDYYSRPLPLPELVPTAARLLSDSDGHLWVERFRLPWETGSTWDVLSSEEGWLTTVELPAGGMIYEIGSDFVLGRWRDSEGVEFVRLHRLRRGG